MLGTYASFLAVLGLSALCGQAVFALCGRRTWSRLSPAVGLAALLALSWATVRLPGRGATTIVVLAATGVLAALVLRGRLVDLRPALRVGLPMELAAAVVGSLPFIAEMRFGILGTSLNPDMSQHLFAADRLADGGVERLISDGYPLGPHALVVALSAIGPSTVHAFDGLQLAVAVSTCLVALGRLESLASWRRIAAALLVGYAYLLASYYVQGAFKEAIEALFVLAFAIGLGDLARAWAAERDGPRQLAGLPLAVIAIGAVYAYSFPGLIWLAATLAAWAAIELGRAIARGGAAGAIAIARAAAPTVGVAIAGLAVAIAPEAGRMADFAGFETFDPDGAGLGNLFDRLSPLETLGIWPSGDFRIEPGDGAVPAPVFYLGALIGAAALAHGLAAAIRRRERALPAALLAAGALWLYSLIGGTPYQEAKALVVLTPLVAMISVAGLFAERLPAVAPIGFALLAGGSSLLALVNGPVGPSDYSPALAELRGQLGARSTFVFAPAELIDEQHGTDYLNWELRGNRICLRRLGEHPPQAPPASSSLVVRIEDGAVVPERLDVVKGPPRADEPCPPISHSARADPGEDE